MMDNNTYITILYDIYSSLFTEKQRLYFEEYYFNNLTLSEISENYNVSRNAIHKQIKNTVDRLIELEDKLNSYKKSSMLDSIILSLEDSKLKEELIKINNI